MDFIDRTLLLLTDTASRNLILDQTALAQMTSAAFDVSIVPIEGPYALDVDRAELGVEISSRVTVEGSWSLPGGTPTNATFSVAGLRIAPALRVDALWRGRLIARTVPQDSRIEEATASFVATDIDRAIAADLGALPADAAVLETERRRRLLAKLRIGMVQPALMGDAVLERMLDAAGVSSVGALLAEGSSALGTLRVRFSAPLAAMPPSPITLPVTVAVLVRDETLKLASLLAESRAVQAALAADPAAVPAPATLRRRAPVLPLWVVPNAAFDDTGWPGGDRAARRAAAGEMLATQGIGLAVHTP